MAVQGFGAGDFAALGKFAWKIYSNVRESRANFGKLNLDVECLLVSVGSLDKGYTQELITDYVETDDGDTRQLEVRALRDSLNSLIMPFYALFETRSGAYKVADGMKSPRLAGGSNVFMYVNGQKVDPGTPRERPWRRWAAASWVQRLIAAFELQDPTELRSRFAAQTANLNLFMTRLTHTQLQRQTELLTLRLSEQSLLRNNFRYSLDLAEGEEDFREDVASYVKFLLDGGKAFTESELQRRKVENRAAAAGKARRRSKSRHRGSAHLDRLVALEQAEKEERAAKLKIELDTDGRNIEALLDDDARLKLAGARQRLALADFKDDPPSLIESESPIEVTSPLNRPATVVRSQSEQILIPGLQRPRELPRRTSGGLTCDVCDRTIPLDRSFYRCASGKCGGRGDTFDVCRRCYSEGENCPGYDQNLCAEMNKVVYKEFE